MAVSNILSSVHLVLLFMYVAEVNTIMIVVPEFYFALFSKFLIISNDKIFRLENR
jgi:hypothetical protein